MRVGKDKQATRHPLFGQILLSQGKVTVEQLDEAIKQQVETRVYLGEVLVNMGVISAEDIADALHIQQNYYPDSGGP